MRASRISSWAVIGLGLSLIGCGPGGTGARSREGAAAATDRGDAVASRLGPHARVLGTVQDGGLPHAACSCERCQSARRDPSRQRWIASLALVLPASERSYLIDATPDLRDQLLRLREASGTPTGRVDRAPVDGIFLTHAHIGHYLGLAFLGYEAVHASRLPVIATPRMAAFLRANGPWSQLVRLENIALQELPPGDARSLGEGVSIAALAAPHRDEFADTVGFLVSGPRRRLLYLPDTDSWAAWETPITEILRAVDVALLDGTFFSLDELPGRSIETIGHPLIPETMNRLQELVDAGRLEVHFTHLNHSNPALDPDGQARRQIEERGFRVLAEGTALPL